MIPCNDDGACIAFERPAFKRHEIAKTRPSLASAVDKFRRIRICGTPILSFSLVK